MNKSKGKDRKKDDLKNQIIQRKNNEIESLKNKISNLQIENREKDELINSIEILHKELSEVVEDLKSKRDEYDNLVSELREMKKVINEEVFKGRWSLVKLLMK